MSLVDLRRVADDAGLPLWWVEGFAAEYLACRKLARAELWEFDFSKVSAADIASVSPGPSVLAAGTVFHNIDRDSAGARMLARMFSGVPVPPALAVEDLVPE
jgi:hypothetical protein